MRILFTAFIVTTCLFIISCTEEGDTIVSGPSDWQGPVIEWQTPPESEVRGTVGIDVTAADSSEIAWVHLYLDGLPKSELTAPPYRFELATDSLQDGVHILEARAIDEHANLGISPILRVNVMNSMAEGPRLLWVPDDYETIQSAINAAQDFDTIRVHDGVYYETLNLFSKGLWIESENGPMECGIDAAGASNVFFIPSCQVIATIRGFRMSAAFNQVLMDDGAQLELYNNLFVASRWQPSFSYDSTYTFILTGSVGGQIVNNLFTGAHTSLQLFSFIGTVRNNIIMNAYDYALWNSDLSENPIIHEYNCFWQNNENYNSGFTQENGEFESNPMINIEDGQLISGSPCLDTGDPTMLDIDSTRSDIGPFGGPLAYP